MTTISLITATYNSENTVGSAIESLNSQTWSAIEHVVIDGNSKDRTVEVVKEASRHLKTLVSEPDKGIYDALNKGLARVQGDVVGFLHSDDFLAHPRVLEQVAAAFADPEVDAVYGDLEYVDKQDISRVLRYWRSSPFTSSKLRRGWMPPHPAFFMRRERYEALGGFNLNLRIAADYDALLRYLSAEGFNARYVNDVFVKMRVGGASNRSLANIIQKSREDWQALKNNGYMPLWPLLWKNFSKLPQFFLHRRDQ